MIIIIIDIFGLEEYILVFIFSELKFIVKLKFE